MSSGWPIRRVSSGRISVTVRVIAVSLPAKILTRIARRRQLFARFRWLAMFLLVHHLTTPFGGATGSRRRQTVP
jgi:hypothetical protein